MDQLDWRKSWWSNSHANCVEVAPHPSGMVGVRDSKSPGPVLMVSAEDWAKFTGSL